MYAVKLTEHISIAQTENLAGFLIECSVIKTETITHMHILYTVIMIYPI